VSWTANGTRKESEEGGDIPWIEEIYVNTWPTIYKVTPDYFSTRKGDGLLWKEAYRQRLRVQSKGMNQDVDEKSRGREEEKGVRIRVEARKDRANKITRNNKGRKASCDGEGNLIYRSIVH